MKGTTQQPRRGFTLVEVLIALSLAALLITAVMATYITCGRLMESQRIRSNLTGSIRVGLDYMVRDVGLAGYGLKGLTGAALSQWFSATWATGITNPVMIQSSGSTAVTLRVVGAFERITSSQTSLSQGDTQLTILSNMTSRFNTTDKYLIYIGRSELARITSINGNQLNFSTDPTAAAEGLVNAYPADTPVELVQVINYSVAYSSSTKTHYLIRYNPAAPITCSYGVPNNTLAAEIAGFTVSMSGRNVSLEVTGQSSSPDPIYVRTHGQNYRRMTMKTDVYLRNL